MSLSSVNLLWKKRYRGLLPVALHSLDESGRALLIRPDEFETRTYQVLSISPEGDEAELGAVSVETVRKFDGLPDGRLLLGMTDDDIYLFRESRKVRFMADRRVVYADACLAGEAGYFVCGFSDALMAHHAVSLGDVNGRLGWNRQLPAPVNRVAISRDGQHLAAGLQNGTVLALDLRRTTVWESMLSEPVTALAKPDQGAACAVGTEAGSVLFIDADGGIRWKSAVGLPVRAVATDAEGRWVAAVVSDDTTHLLTCLGPDGSPVWELDLESRPTGVCLSSDARHLVVTLANGSTSAFSVELSEAGGYGGVGRIDSDRRAAMAAAEMGDLESAHTGLRAVLHAAPHDLEAADLLADVERRRVEVCRAEARSAEESADYSAAIAALDAALSLAPWDEGLFRERLELRERALAGLTSRAERLEESRAWEEASAAWQEVLRLDPARREVRERLLRLRAEQAAALVALGDERQAEGDILSASALWQQAQRLDPADEIAERLRTAEVERCVTAGIAYYEAGRMPEAEFQLKKALALDPHHEQAHRYLGYAQGQTGDNRISDRFSRLE